MARSYSTAYKIPSGKLVRIFTGRPNNSENEVFRMMLTQELTLPIEGNYTSVVNSNNTSTIQSFANMLGDRVQNEVINTITSWIGGLNTKLGYSVYTGGEPIKLSLSGRFTAVTNAFDEVITPIRKLQLMAVAKEDSSGFMSDLPGMDPIEAFSDSQTGSSSSKWGYIKIGNFALYNVIFTRITVSWSEEVDQTGYPISADVQLDVQTVRIATENTINEWYNTSESGEAYTQSNQAYTNNNS